MDYRNYVGAPAQYQLMRDWQLEFLTALPEFDHTKTFLDIGCGSMRLGAVLIPKLSPGNYIGLDLNQKMVEAGIHNECGQLDLDELQPEFIYTDCFDMSSIDKPVHMAWAQAVFNHLNLSTIKVCLTNLKHKLDTQGVFYSTYWPGDTEVSNDSVSDFYDGRKRDIRHTTENMQTLYADCGFTFEAVDKTALGQTVIRSVHA